MTMDYEFRVDGLLPEWGRDAFCDMRIEEMYGVRVGSQGASLLYQEDGKFGDMQLALVMTPEKTAGQGFGSPGSSADGDTIQKSDIFIKYDPRTKNGYSLRYWRTVLSAEKVMFQLFKIVNGVGSPVDSQQVLTGVFKPNTYLLMSIIGGKFTASAYNDADDEVLFAGQSTAHREIETTMFDDVAAERQITGRHVPVSWIWRRLAGREADHAESA